MRTILSQAIVIVPLILVVSPSVALAGGSADEIRKTIVGRTCSGPGITFHFGRDGTFVRQETQAWARWGGTYKVSEGAVSFDIQSGPSIRGNPIRGVSVANTWITGTTMHITSFYGHAQGGTVAFRCR